jgi:hypothetical protein
VSLAAIAFECERGPVRGLFPFPRILRAPVVAALLVAAGVLATPSARAQEDAGVADAGPDPCDPRCEGDTLSFCDGDTPATLDCRTLNGRCATITGDWGSDCVLGASEPCDPGYAFGASRCDRTASLFCIDGTCTAASGPPPAEPDEQPTDGTELKPTTTTTNPFGCTDCGTGQAAALLPALVLLRGLARARRRSLQGS